MPLRITNSVTDVALINRWAEEIEARVNTASNQAGHALTTLQRPVVIPPVVTDGLTHLDTVWEHDSAYVELRDDFVPFFATTFGPALPNNAIGELGWFLQPTAGAINLTLSGGNPPYLGTASWENNATVNSAVSLLLNAGLTPGSLTQPQFQRNSFALLENPGWKMTWVFKHDGTAQGTGNFLTAGKEFYIGLSGAPIQNLTNANVFRPDIFIGLRYDTSTVPAGMSVSNSSTGGLYFGSFTGGGANAFAGQNITFNGFTTTANNGTFLCTASTTSQLTVNNASSTNESPARGIAVLASIPLTAVANASGGSTVYTMVDVNGVGSGANGAYIGLTFVVTGFVNGVNNGTFVCNQSSATQLTLVNASGTAETHAGFATTPSLNDSFYTFEAVANPQYTTAARHNKQGQTFVTSVAPTMGVWHRLDITCSATGVVVLTLDGSSTNTVIFTVPQVTYTAANGQVSCNTHEGRVLVDTVGTSGTAFVPPFATGSTITVSGLSGGNLALNGTWQTFYGEGTTFRWNAPAVGNIGNNSTTFSLVGYSALTPMCVFGNDDTASPITGVMRNYVDFFSFVWNPNLGPSSPGTPDKTKARGW